MVSVVQAAASRVTAQDDCLTFSVAEAASASVAAALAGGAKDAPAAWVSDSTVFVDAVRAARPDAIEPDVQELATSPLVFAVPAAIAAKAGRGAGRSVVVRAGRRHRHGSAAADRPGDHDERPARPAHRADRPG